MQFIKFPNSKVWQTSESGWISGTVLVSDYEEKDLEQRMDAISAAATGSICGLTDFSYQYLGGDLVSFHGCASILDEEPDDCVDLPADSAELRQLLAAQYQLKPSELDHLLNSLASSFDDECVIPVVGSVRQIRCPAYPSECDYVRVTVDGMEVAYWSVDEWSEAPADVMGAILGAARGG